MLMVPVFVNSRIELSWSYLRFPPRTSMVPLLYAVPERGKTLEPQIGRYVSLYGVASYRSDLVRGAEVMTVSNVGSP